MQVVKVKKHRYIQAQIYSLFLRNINKDSSGNFLRQEYFVQKKLRVPQWNSESEMQVQ